MISMYTILIVELLNLLIYANLANLYFDGYNWSNVSFDLLKKKKMDILKIIIQEF